MEWDVLIVLPGLALVDSTSVGTLLLPAWLLLSPRVRPRAVLGYLAVVAGAYWLLGFALLLGAKVTLSILDGAGDAARPVPLLVAQLIIASALLVWALLPMRWRRLKGVTVSGGTTSDGLVNITGRPGLLTRWRNRLGEGETHGGLLALAAAAVLLEAATMLPYLGAVTLLAAADLPDGVPALALAGYCLVMIAPALLLVLGRTVAAQRVETLLRRLDQWSRRAGGEALLWVAGIAGFLLARDAAVALGLL
ncbi:MULTISPECIES: GAP family protein [unclassified Ornithinimicrobium]|uniref:GAP family protein n=1 Tax=unclassified Ornithinimicrobium TaxID=2615080 RepID=UPI003853942F